jgi:hypothetical protein
LSDLRDCGKDSKPAKVDRNSGISVSEAGLCGNGYACATNGCFDVRLLSHWCGWRRIEHGSDKTDGILGTQIVLHKTYGNLRLPDESPPHGRAPAKEGGIQGYCLYMPERWELKSASIAFAPI